ncbi:unnamed protein product [Blepharisma stoltei]|uniref:Uncharacterized protein n=1 Tax=Blepharisma stoltei TaxID=1481888 RepID=A0AAU9JVF8_9CILI|nr:unnamed protein product [Blepharisma stoltei]
MAINIDDHDPGYIPPPPTREQEIEYIENLEKEFRNRHFRHRNYAPDPTRRFWQSYDDKITHYRLDYWLKFLLGAFLAVPLAGYLTRKSPSKSSFMNIPFRTYPYQQNFRFWTFFLTYDLGLAYGFAHLLKNTDYFEPLIPLTREKKL